MKNLVLLIGHVDNEIKVTNSENVKISNFSLATNEVIKKSDGTKETKTTWHQISAFGKTDDIIEMYVSKGDLLHIEGKIQNSQYEDKEIQGLKHFRSEIVVKQLLFLTIKKDVEQSVIQDESLDNYIPCLTFYFIKINNINYLIK